MEDLDRKITSVSGTVERMSDVIIDKAQGKFLTGYMCLALLTLILAQIYKNVMHCLNPSDQSEIHEAALRRHEAGTGQWFLVLDTFQNWRTDPGTSLWLCGESL